MFPGMFSSALTVLVALGSRAVSVVKATDSMVQAVSISIVEDVGSWTFSSVPSVVTFTELAVRLKTLSMSVVGRGEGERGKELRI
jgi:hypothetical protein